MASVHYKDRHIFAPHEHCVKVCGITPYSLYNVNAAVSRRFEVLYKIVDYLLTANLITTTILYIITTYKNYYVSLDKCCDALSGTVICTYAVVQALYYKFVANDMIEMLQFMRKHYAHRSEPGFTRVTIDAALRICDLFITYWFLLGTLSVIFFTFAEPVFSNQLRLHITYPFDIDTPLIYGLVFLSQLFVQIKSAISYTMVSGLYVSMAIFMCAQYDVLFCNLKNFIAIAAIRCKKHPSMLRSLKKFYDKAKEEPDQYLRCAEVDDLQYSTNWNDIENNHTLYESSPEFRKELQDTIKRCVIHHIFILDLFRRFEKFNNPCLMLKVFCIIFQLCLLGFVTVKSSEQNKNVIEILSTLNYFLLTTYDLFLFTYYGELLARQSVRLVDAVQRTPWHPDMTVVKTDILIMLENCRKPIQLTAGKIFPLNIDQFRSIITTAFSYITILQSFDEGK